MPFLYSSLYPAASLYPLPTLYPASSVYPGAGQPNAPPVPANPASQVAGQPAFLPGRTRNTALSSYPEPPGGYRLNPLQHWQPADGTDSPAPPQPGPSQGSQPEKTQPSHLNLALIQMLKIAGAVVLLRMAFHLTPKGLFLLLKSTEKFHLQSKNPLVQFMQAQTSRLKRFMETRDKEHGSSLFKSMMAIIDGLLMLYVGGLVDRYFSKKSNKFKPPQSSDPEKVVDKVLLVLIATERMENLMHHLFHWLDKHPSSGRQFIYGELAALSAVGLDTGVKIASDRYKLKKNTKFSPPKPTFSSSG